MGESGDGNKMLDKFIRTKPYNVFFNSTRNVSDDNTITFRDLLCPSLGTLKASLQINFLVDLYWLHDEYQSCGYGAAPMTVVYGSKTDNETIDALIKSMPNLKLFHVGMKDIFGINHTRMSIFEYTDGSVRVAIFTANLKSADWRDMNQSLWLSDACPKMEAHSIPTEGGGPANFKECLLHYLLSYNMPAAMDEWLALVKRTDFTNVKVALIASAPGPHYIKGLGCHSLDMAFYLKRHSTLPLEEPEKEEHWPIVAQVTSLEIIGETPDEWLKPFFLHSVGKHKLSEGDSAETQPELKLYIVHPSKNNASEMQTAMPDDKETDSKEYQELEWLKSYLYQWKADDLERSTMVPYSKSYCRMSPDMSKLAWYLLTSANLAKSDWGVKWNTDLYVRSFELGVLFIPQFFEMEYFPVNPGEGHPNFPIMFDVPLVPYESDDIPY